MTQPNLTGRWELVTFDEAERAPVGVTRWLSQLA